MNNTNLELTPVEKSRLIAILSKVYAESLNLFEIATIKNILEKLGETVEEWIPAVGD